MLPAINRRAVEEDTKSHVEFPAGRSSLGATAREYNPQYSYKASGRWYSPFYLPDDLDPRGDALTLSRSRLSRVGLSFLSSSVTRRHMSAPQDGRSFVRGPLR